MELLAASVELKLLVTSREAFRLYGEHEFPVAPHELSVEALLQYPSIALLTSMAVGLI
jgi:predicted ATPase